MSYSLSPPFPGVCAEVSLASERPMQGKPPDDSAVATWVRPTQLECGGVKSLPRTGRGTAIAHHGELFQGVVEGSSGRLHRSLVSLPCRIFKSDATFIPLRNRKINVEPEWKVKALRGVQLALDYTGYGGWGGALRIDSNIAVGWGLGSSNSDVTAAICAVADGLERRLLPEEIAYLAVQAETASDS